LANEPQVFHDPLVSEHQKTFASVGVFISDLLPLDLEFK